MAVTRYFIRVFWISLALVPFLVLAALFFPGYSRLQGLRRSQSELQDQIRDMQGEIDRLQEIVDRIKNDPGFYESLAREELGAIKEGEIVIQIRE